MSSPVVASCGTGVTACVLALGAQLAGKGGRCDWCIIEYPVHKTMMGEGGFGLIYRVLRVLVHLSRVIARRNDYSLTRHYLELYKCQGV